MKTYVKPSLEFIELRPEERLASCVDRDNGKGLGHLHHVGECINTNGKYTGHCYDDHYTPKIGNAYGHTSFS
jgi:hypothetical protein